MSTEFFSIMNEIEGEAKKIKFLEGSHPELYLKYHKDVVTILDKIKNMRSKIEKDLEKKSRTFVPGKPKL